MRISSSSVVLETACDTIACSTRANSSVEYVESSLRNCCCSPDGARTTTSSITSCRFICLPFCPLRNYLGRPKGESARATEAFQVLQLANLRFEDTVESCGHRGRGFNFLDLRLISHDLFNFVYWLRFLGDFGSFLE